MAKPIWLESEQRWKLRIMRDGEKKVFTSIKPGRPGLMEVNRKLRDWEQRSVSKADWKLSKCWPLFLADIECKNGRGDHYIQNEMYGRLYILPILGSRPASSISSMDWQNLINTAKPVGKVKKDGKMFYQTKVLSKKSLSNLRGVIMLFCSFAIRSCMIESLPMALYVPKAAPKIGKQILQPDGIKALFEPSTEWYINAWRFEVLTGLRPGEVLGIQKSDYYDGMLTIRRSVNARGQVTPGKNANALRTIYLHKIALKTIEDQLQQIADIQTDWIFCDTVGRMPKQSGSYDGWKRISKERSIPGSPYSLRHTFISMVKNDLPVEMIKAIVGHSANMDTFGVYGHEVDGEMERSAKILDITFAKIAQ